MEKIRSFKDLILWQKSKDFAVSIYGATSDFPIEEKYGLSNQLRRAVVSIPSNVAEGFNRRSVKEKKQFLRVAYGSGAEIETQLMIAQELKFIQADDCSLLMQKLNEIMRIINAVLKKL